MSHLHELPDSLLLDHLLEGDLTLVQQIANLQLQNNLSSETQLRPLHYNKPQLRSAMVGANAEYAIWGRGTGKSEGLIAPRSFRNVQVMARGHGCFVGATYLQLLERTLPPVVKGWENMGWVRGQDFWIRERPPKHLGIPEPIVGPLTPEHCIFFRNGTVASMVSQDRPGSANGKTVHWIVGDEAKLLDKEALDNELLMTNRGDDRYFGGIPEFHSVLFATDMPTTKEAKWILEMEKLMNPVRIEALLAIQIELYKLRSQLLVYPNRMNSIRAKMAELQKKADQLRLNTLYVSLASTLDNLAGFGMKALLDLKQRLPPFIFGTAILNRKPFLTENSFYPDLDERRHFYDAIDYAHVDSFEFGKGEFDSSRKDADVDRYRPLDVSLDYGAKINTLTSGQLFGRQFRFQNSLYVRHPQRMKDLAKQFCHYNRHHGCKEVNYYYDHTALVTSATDDVSYADAWQQYLEAEGWSVNMCYIGHTPTPQNRYELWGTSLRGGDHETFTSSFNRANTEYLRISMQNTQIKEGSDGYRKEKKDERNLAIDQRETTHFSDCADTLLVGVHLYNKTGSQWVAIDAAVR